MNSILSKERLCRSFFMVKATKKRRNFPPVILCHCGKLRSRFIAVWWLSTPPKFDFTRLNPPKCLILRGNFKILAEMSTEFSTSCGKLFGKAVEKSTGRGEVFHRGRIAFRGNILSGTGGRKGVFQDEIFSKRGCIFAANVL